MSEPAAFITWKADRDFIYASAAAGTVFANSRGARVLQLHNTAISLQTIFEAVGGQLKFNEGSVTVQLDSACLMLCSKFSCPEDRAGRNLDEAKATLLKDYRDELLYDYREWCKFMGIETVKLADQFISKPSDEGYAACVEVALMMLIWGEAANLRFCSEYMAWLYHVMATKLVKCINAGSTNVPRDMGLDGGFLAAVITPVYSFLATEVAKAKTGDKEAVDHTVITQYDDFNEIFWNSAAIEDVAIKPEEPWPRINAAIEAQFCKSFLERQSWVHVVATFSRVYVFHVSLVSLLIALARCELEQPEDVTETSPSACTTEAYLLPVVTLYVCLLLKELYTLYSAAVLLGKRRAVAVARGPRGARSVSDEETGVQSHPPAVRNRDGWPDVLISVLRFIWKFGMLMWMLWSRLDGRDNRLGEAASRYHTLNSYNRIEVWALLLVLAGELLPTSLAYSSAPGRAQLRTSWRARLALLQSLLYDSSSVTVFTTGVLKRPPSWPKKILYTVFWVIVLASKSVFDYYVIVKPLYRASKTIYSFNEGMPADNVFDFALFRWNDPHNFSLLAVLWLGTVLVFVMDTSIFFVLWANVFAFFGGLKRRVGEVSTMGDVMNAFDSAHDRFFYHLSIPKRQKQIMFAKLWNTVIDTMREEDLLCDKDATAMRCYVLEMKLDVEDTSAAQRSPLSHEVKIAVRPLFLFSGALQRTVEAVQLANKRFSVVKSTGGAQTLAHAQRDWMKTLPDKSMASEAIHQTLFSTFVVLDDLLASVEGGSELRESFMALYKSFYGVLGEDAKPMAGCKPDEAIRSAFLAGTSVDLSMWPAVVKNLTQLLKALLPPAVVQAVLEGQGQTADLQAGAARASQSVVELLKSMGQMLTPARQGPASGPCEDLDEDLDALLRKFQKSLVTVINSLKGVQDLPQSRFHSNRAAAAGGESTPAHTAFLTRFLQLLTEKANAQPGQVGTADARRRIKFFMNAMFMHKKKPRSAMHMPSWSTLTPVHKETVITPLASLRRVTEDNVNELKYLHSIYPKEWSAFHERLYRTYPKRHRLLHQLLYGKLTQAGLADAIVKQEAALLRELGVDESTVEALAAGELKDAAEKEAADIVMELQLWSSYRQQTLARTVRGIMRYRQAVQLLAALEMEHAPDCNGGPAATAANNRSAARTTVTATSAAASATAAPAHGGTSGVLIQYSQPDVEMELHALGDVIEPENLKLDFSPITATYPKAEQLLDGKPTGVWKLAEEVAEAKYSYVVSCQVYDCTDHNSTASAREQRGFVDYLARRFTGLRIAYVENSRKSVSLPQQAAAGPAQYTSVLFWYNDAEDKLPLLRKVPLPGDILVGESKPANQNHAIIFTTGEAIQAIDMNQDSTLEDALVQREMLQEFNFNKKLQLSSGTVAANLGKIVGFREHVFTHNVSSVAKFFSMQELGFVTSTQRVLDEVLAVRFHYGHPDVFDRTTAITMGGISRPSKGMHVSEDIFAGFNWVLRGGESIQLDFIQAGKGRDVGVSQITAFTSKIAGGNGMQMRSREIARLFQQMDFPRALSCYYSSVGGFVSQSLLILGVFFYMYSKVMLVFISTSTGTVASMADVSKALNTTFLLQLGFVLVIPSFLTVCLEEGVFNGVSALLESLTRLSPFFYVFTTGATAHSVNSAVTQSKAAYKATGRGFVIVHESFRSIFMTNLLSHFLPAFELLVLLIMYAEFTVLPNYLLETFSVYILVVGWLYAPLMFNPNGLEFVPVRKDWQEWLEWMCASSNDPEKSWFAFYDKLTDDARCVLHAPRRLPWSGEQRGRLAEQLELVLTAVLSRKFWELSVMHLRFLVMSWCFIKGVETERLANGSSFWGVSWMFGAVVLIAVGQFVLITCVGNIFFANEDPYAYPSNRRSARFLLCGSTLVSFIILGLLLYFDVLSFKELLFSLAAILFTLYFLAKIFMLCVPHAVKLLPVRLCAFILHFAIGTLIQLPALGLSYVPPMSEIQTRLQFNAQFAQVFKALRLLAGREVKID